MTEEKTRIHTRISPETEQKIAAAMNLKKIYCEVFCQVIDQSDSRKSMDRQRKELIAKCKSKASDAFSGKRQ